LLLLKEEEEEEEEALPPSFPEGGGGEGGGGKTRRSREKGPQCTSLLQGKPISRRTCSTSSWMGEVMMPSLRGGREGGREGGMGERAKCTSLLQGRPTSCRTCSTSRWMGEVMMPSLRGGGREGGVKINGPVFAFLVAAGVLFLGVGLPGPGLDEASEGGPGREEGREGGEGGVGEVDGQGELLELYL